MEKLGKNIKKRFEQDGEQFRKNIQNEIEQFERRIKNSLTKNSLTMLNHINLDSVSDPKFNIHSGIDKLGLISSIGGLALLLATPVLGEIALAAGIVLGAIGIVKSLWNFLIQTIKNPNRKKKWIRI